MSAARWAGRLSGAVRRLADEWADNWRYAVEADARDEGRPPPGPPSEPLEPRLFAVRVVGGATLATAGAGVWRLFVDGAPLVLDSVVARGWPSGLILAGGGTVGYAYNRWRWRRHRGVGKQPGMSGG